MTTKALGLIETIGLITAIEAADTALKAANVKLLGYENTKGGGRITIKLVGDVGAVKAAVAAGVAAAERIGRIESSLVIPRPHQEIEGLVSYVDRGPVRVAEPAVIPPEAPAKPAVVMPESPAVPKTKAPAPAKAKAEKPKAAAGRAKPARSAPKPKLPAPATQVETVIPAEAPVSPAQIEEVIPAVEPESLVPSAVEPESQLPSASEPESQLPSASEPGSEQPLSS